MPVSGRGDTKYICNYAIYFLHWEQWRAGVWVNSTQSPLQLSFVTCLYFIKSIILCTTVCFKLLPPRPSALKVKQNRPGSPASVDSLPHLINSSFSHDTIIIGEGKLPPREVSSGGDFSLLSNSYCVLDFPSILEVEQKSPHSSASFTPFQVTEGLTSTLISELINSLMRFFSTS